MPPTANADDEQQQQYNQNKRETTHGRGSKLKEPYTYSLLSSRQNKICSEITLYQG
jgi:hypothetical protein